MPNSREVADYLKKHPDFFVKRRDLLDAMNLSEGGSDADAAPFHERRVQALRDRHDRQQAQFDLMLDTARNNQDLEDELHQIAVTLLSHIGEHFDADNPAAPATLVKTRFGIDQVALFTASHCDDFASQAQVDYPLLCRRVEHLASVCDDRVSRKLSASLFPDAPTIASCAFVPLVTSERRELCGVMVLGAADQQRFQPNMGVSILDRLGQLIGAYLQGRGWV